MSKSLKIVITVSLFFAGQTFLAAQNKRLISGIITDVKTKEALPYVTVSLKKQLIGIVSNEEGKFDLYVPEEALNDTLLVSYLGYKHVLISLSQVKELLDIRLEETVVQLEEVVVRPLSPENYIQMAMRKVKENYPKNPFQTEAYYREKILENKNLIQYDEGIFKTYYPSFIDTSKTQNQLLLFKRAENVEKVAFMRKERKRKEEKDSLNKKNGEDSKFAIDIGESFGGPAEVLEGLGIVRDTEAFLDTAQFKSYKYSFAKSSSYNTSELVVIDFATKGKVNHVREAGKVYIDLSSMAIVKIECKGDFILPGVVKSILFFMSIGVKNPVYQKESEFQQVKGKWYPKNIYNFINLKLSNKHLFRKDEYSDLEIDQFFAVNELKTENVSVIPPSKRFVEDKEMEKQVHNDNGITWEGMNIIKK